VRKAPVNFALGLIMTMPVDLENWLQWMLTTSIPLMRLDTSGNVIAQASGTMIDFEGGRFLISVAHAVPKDSTGWAIEIGLDPRKGTEVYHVRAFVYPAEFTRSTKSFRELDLCVARVSADVDPWYEFRTFQGLFDRRPRHIFRASDLASPDANSTYAFSGRVRPERHGTDAFVSEMNVYPGLKFAQSMAEVHEFRLPVPHPGHDAFRGCSGAPMVSTARKVVGFVSSGCEGSNIVRAIAVDRCIPALEFLLAQGAL
jgi:hypothetical protein